MNTRVFLKGSKERVTDMIRFTVGCCKDYGFFYTVFALKLGKVLCRFFVLRKEKHLTVASNILLDSIIPNCHSAALIGYDSDGKSVGAFCGSFSFSLLVVVSNENKLLHYLRTKATEGIFISKETVRGISELLIIGIHDILLCFRSELIEEYVKVLVFFECGNLFKGNNALNELSFCRTVGIEIEPSNRSLFLVHIEAVIAETVLIKSKNLFPLFGKNGCNIRIGIVLICSCRFLNWQGFIFLGNSYFIAFIKKLLQKLVHCVIRETAHRNSGRLSFYIPAR